MNFVDEINVTIQPGRTIRFWSLAGKLESEIPIEFALHCVDVHSALARMVESYRRIHRICEKMGAEDSNGHDIIFQAEEALKKKGSKNETP